MGNKRAILPFIIDKLNHTGVVKRGETILDLFAGTHSVGYGFKENFKILANDIQEYSYVIGKALVENNEYVEVKQEDVMILQKYAILNYCHLLKIKSKFRSQYSSKRSTKNHQINKFYKGDNKRFPYCLFSFYYAEKFFTAETCMWIDSFRYAIDKLLELDKKEYKQAVLLTNLMYSMNMTVLSTGHFAQYLTNEPNLDSVRARKIWDIFFEKCMDTKIVKSNYKNEVFNLHYLDLLKNKKLRKQLAEVSLVYMDPPYSAANYSRYYHIPETLVKYDYPDSYSKGCYRSDRHFSRFCSARDANAEMETAIKEISLISSKIKLAISYSNKGLVPLKTLQGICRKYFKSVRSPKIEYHHQSLGKSVMQVDEVLIVCQKPFKR